MSKKVTGHPKSYGFRDKDAVQPKAFPVVVNDPKKATPSPDEGKGGKGGPAR